MSFEGEILDTMVAVVKHMVQNASAFTSLSTDFKRAYKE
jgi:hypothetical protein